MKKRSGICHLAAGVASVGLQQCGIESAGLQQCEVPTGTQRVALPKNKKLKPKLLNVVPVLEPAVPIPVLVLDTLFRCSPLLEGRTFFTLYGVTQLSYGCVRIC
ncbi:uncharacterized protein LOC122194987 [Lactuca sativa]|uniref:uncharacterized protein LOC122194987 n=1 Tax=Lactuca sativa TaxID=4236 RepID=UPI001C690090|nr:uncharacterized protein LOC122194987 [Lactuca sativa]